MSISRILAGRPRDTNYDLLADGYTYIVSLLCPIVPWCVDSDGLNLFVKEDLSKE